MTQKALDVLKSELNPLIAERHALRARVAELETLLVVAEDMVAGYEAVVLRIIEAQIQVGRPEAIAGSARNDQCLSAIHEFRRRAAELLRKDGA